MWPFLQEIEGKWEEFAHHLQIDKKKIDNIRANCFAGANNKESCEKMLSYWIDKTLGVKRKWSTIKEAANKLGRKDLVKLLVSAGVDGMIILPLLCM